MHLYAISINIELSNDASRIHQLDAIHNSLPKPIRHNTKFIIRIP